MEQISSFFDKMKKSQHRSLETWFQKAVRHVLSGEFDRETIKSGIQQAHDLLVSYKFRNEKYNLGNLESHFQGNKGLTVVTYEVKLPEYGNRRMTTAFVTEFPSDCVIQPKIFNPMMKPEKVDDVLQKTSAIAAIVGPTFESQYPNNGFFSTEHGGLLQEFGVTNPPGQRRGAIAINKNGELQILDEQQKQDAIATQFENFSLVAGTSMYITSEDPPVNNQLLQKHESIRVTYLVQYIDAQGRDRFAHILLVALVNRERVKKLLTLHSEMRNWQKYIAVELEHLGGDCIVKNVENNLSSVQSNVKPSTQPRLDHYLIYR
ncbi:MAG: hypothetical protein WAU07_02935 [Microgenomates group bacterium]